MDTRVYDDFENKINEIIIVKQISETQLKNHGLLYYLSLDDYFKTFYLPILSHHQKSHYGEVNTPQVLTNELVDTLVTTPLLSTSIEKHQLLFSTPTFLDIGAGLGFISASLIKRLWSSLPHEEQTPQAWITLTTHITLAEINPHNCKILRILFGSHIHIHQGDFLQWFPRLTLNTTPQKVIENDGYDVVYGNPPFNANGLIKVPTNTLHNKKHDGKAIWRNFIFHSISHCIRTTGYLCLFIPSIWLKGDEQSGLYALLLREHQLLKMKCFNNTQTNLLFKNHAQTHCGLFLFQMKNNADSTFLHWSWFKKAYIETQIPLLDEPIPVLDTEIERKIKAKLNDVFEKHGLEKRRIPIIKTSTLSKKRIVSDLQGDTLCIHPCVSSCVFTKDTDGAPQLVFEYTNELGPYSNQSKIILAHGMYGIPFVDEDGLYGISRRDKYLILKENVKCMKTLAWFLSTPLCLFMFENYKYRMRYLEKAGFQWLYDVSLLIDYGFPYNDKDALYTWFDLTEKEIDYIELFERKQF